MKKILKYLSVTSCLIFSLSFQNVHGSAEMGIEGKGNVLILNSQALGNILGLKGNLKKSASAMDVIKRFGELFRNGENVSPKDFISYLSFGFIKAGKASFLPNASNGMIYVREKKAKKDEKSEIFKTIFSAVSMMKGEDFEKFIQNNMKKENLLDHVRGHLKGLLYYTRIAKTLYDNVDSDVEKFKKLAQFDPKQAIYSLFDHLPEEVREHIEDGPWKARALKIGLRESDKGEKTWKETYERSVKLLAPMRIPYDSLNSEDEEKPHKREDSLEDKKDEKESRAKKSIDKIIRIQEPVRKAPDIIKISQDKDPDFFNLPSQEKKIEHLLKQFNLIPLRYFEQNNITIEQFPPENTANTEEVYKVEVKTKVDREDIDPSQSDRIIEKDGVSYFNQLAYVVKIPTKAQSEKEKNGLVWAAELLPKLPMNGDWPELKFHESIFSPDDGRDLIFLHGAKGMSWAKYFISAHIDLQALKNRKALEQNDPQLKEKLEKQLQEYIDCAYRVARGLGLLERRFIRGNWEQAEKYFEEINGITPTDLKMQGKSLYSHGPYTIAFLDPHAGNIFYNPKTKKVSWIDLSTLGHSAHSYFDKEALPTEKFAPEDLTQNAKTPLGMGLNMLLYSNYPPKTRQGVYYTRQKGMGLTSESSFAQDIFDAMVSGYKSAFEDLPEKKKKIVDKVIDNLEWYLYVKNNPDHYLLRRW